MQLTSGDRFSSGHGLITSDCSGEITKIDQQKPKILQKWQF